MVNKWPGLLVLKRSLSCKILCNMQRRKTFVWMILFLITIIPCHPFTAFALRCFPPPPPLFPMAAPLARSSGLHTHAWRATRPIIAATASSNAASEYLRRKRAKPATASAWRTSSVSRETTVAASSAGVLPPGMTPRSSVPRSPTLPASEEVAMGGKDAAHPCLLFTRTCS